MSENQSKIELRDQMRVPEGPKCLKKSQVGHREAKMDANMAPIWLQYGPNGLPRDAQEVTSDIDLASA